MPEVTEAEVLAALPLVARQAAYLSRRLPAGLTAEDLESAGQEALVVTAREFDPGLGRTFEETAARAIRNAMTATIQKKARENRRREPLEIPLDAAGEETAPRRDPRAPDPTAVACVRESLRPAGRRNARVVISRVEADSPSGAEVGGMVARLREAMFAALHEWDVAEVMQAVVRKAKRGNVGAARLLFDQLASKRSGVQVQQAVVINAAPEEMTG
jgi:hypothetical protein